MFKTKLGKSLLVIAISCLSLNAYANDLTIINETNQDSTSRINDALFCSDALPNGVTYKHSKNVVPEMTMRVACTGKLDNCKADVYMALGCSGDLITTIYFSIYTGIKSMTPPKNGYQISYTPFSITMSGGPSIKTK